MKKLVFFILIIFQASYLNAQSLLITGDTIVYGDPTVEIVSYLTVKNISAQLLNVICEKNVISQGWGGDNFFCWGGTCLTSSTIISPDFTTIAANSSSTEFQGHFTGNVGSTATIEYCFYPENDPADESCIIINYGGSISTSTTIKKNTILISEFYPNPAKEIVCFDYYLNKPAKLVVMDILGNEVKRIRLSERGTQKINISDLSKGIYFGNVVVNNETIAIKKLIVR
jgi:hypothetical protein